jgi:cell division protein FtsQ
MNNRFTLLQPQKQVKKTSVKFKAAFLKFIFLMLFLALFVVGFNFTRPSNAPIKRVKIVATYKHVDQKLLQEIVLPFLNAGFFYINVFGLQNTIIKQIPWVHNVYVQREWPNGIIMQIEEQEAFAVWNNSALFNASGDLFAPDPSTFPQNIPMLYGPEAQGRDVFETLKKIQAIVMPLNFTIRELNLTPQHYWHFVVDGGMVVYLGDTEIFERLAAMVKLYPKIVATHHGAIESIDLRYSNGFAVK